MMDVNFEGRTGNSQQDEMEEDGQTGTQRAANNEVWILDLDVWNAGAP